MKQFAILCDHIYCSKRSEDKLQALVQYLGATQEEHLIWAIALLSSVFRPKRIVRTGEIKKLGKEVSELPEWLLSQCYDASGDVSEVVSQIVISPKTTTENVSLSACIELIGSHYSSSDQEKEEFIKDIWANSNLNERYIFNKLITGSFRISVPQKIMSSAIAQVLNQNEYIIATILQSSWRPSITTFSQLFADTNDNNNVSRPYPFFLAGSYTEELPLLGPPEDWMAEWKWRGLRCQLIKKSGAIFIWSREEELVTNQYPEFENLSQFTDANFVIDGHLLIYKHGKFRSDYVHKNRAGKKKVSKKMLEEFPVVLIAYDLIELNDRDLRTEPLSTRREQLESLVLQINEKYPERVFLSDEINFLSWDDLALKRSEARVLNAGGIMLKSLHSDYKHGRHESYWWKWNLEPYTINAVMLYAHRGQGHEASEYVAFTFAVSDHQLDLMPLAKVSSIFQSEESELIKQFIKDNTIERFGPARSVTPELVFQLSFEDISISSRRKSGVVLHNPKVIAWLKEKTLEDIGSLIDIKRLIKG